MAKVRLESEWKLWAGVAAVTLLIVGYLYLASRPPMEGGEYLWNVTKIVDSKTLSLRGSGNVIQFRLAGLIVPKSGEKPLQDFLASTLLDQWIRIKTLREGPDGTKEGFVYLSGDDITARIVRQGLAKIDRDETTFDVRPYIELEQEAQKQKKGLWSE
ncbi:MAG: thermonuclease family protein [Desulfomonile tiedjei]|nr:thermonuclease family protein [Desulfomonile tiedjei]